MGQLSAFVSGVLLASTCAAMLRLMSPDGRCSARAGNSESWLAAIKELRAAAEGDRLTYGSRELDRLQKDISAIGGFISMIGRRPASAETAATRHLLSTTAERQSVSQSWSRRSSVTPPQWSSAVHVSRREILNALPQSYPLGAFEGGGFADAGIGVGALLLRHRDEWPSMGPPSDPFEPCGEIDLVVTSTERPRCLLIAETHKRTAMPYFVERHCRGWMSFDGQSGGEHCSNDYNVTPRIAARPSSFTQNGAGGPANLRDELRAWKLQEMLLQRVGELLGKGGRLHKLLQRIARPSEGHPKRRHNGNIVVMATNSGNVHLVLNWYCSAKAAKLNTDNVLVFTSDEPAERAIKAAGLNAFRTEALGSLPEKAAQFYGDSTFAQMMWLKTVSVFLVVKLGYNALFQDADVLWFRDPWPLLDSGKLAMADALFQDDGARSTRFGPFFSNSGFYLIRASGAGSEFVNMMLHSQHLVFKWYSQQAALNYLLHDARSTLGLDVHVLPTEHFPSGKQFHHDRDLMRSFFEGTRVPAAFHMCWTASGKEKVRQLSAVRWWFLNTQCTEPVTDAMVSKHEGCCTVPDLDPGQSRWDMFVRLKNILAEESRRGRAKPAPKKYQCTHGSGSSRAYKTFKVTTKDACMERCNEIQKCVGFDFAGTGTPLDPCRLYVTVSKVRPPGRHTRTLCYDARMAQPQPSS